MSTKRALSVFFIVVFLSMLLTCWVVYDKSEPEYIQAQARVAKKTADSISIFNLNPTVDASEVDDIENKRTLCVVGMIVSAIGIGVCVIILICDYSNNTPNNNNKDNTKENYYLC